MAGHNRYRVSFKIRKPYFEAIKEGRKRQEVRRVSTFWARRLLPILYSRRSRQNAIATFLCGARVHRRRIIGVSVAPDARTALGRAPSAQGAIDLGSGPVFVIHLGEKAP